jgi:hypothetical protein
MKPQPVARINTALIQAAINRRRVNRREKAIHTQKPTTQIEIAILIYS